MPYGNFRANIDLPYVKDIYVEVRTQQGRENLVGFFRVHDSTVNPADILATIQNDWPESELDRQVLESLDGLAPAHLVYCDSGMTTFPMCDVPFSIGNFRQLTQQQYIDFINGLGNVPLSNRVVRPPRYPALLSPYSVWHYRLNWVCKVRDMDYIEIRDDQPKAILEVTGRLTNEGHLQNSLNQIKDRLNIQKEIMSQVGAHLGIPGYFVIHTTDLQIFYIYDLSWRRVARLDQQGYTQWIETL